MKHERAWAYAAFAIVCVVWGTTYLGIAIALETVPPLLLTGIALRHRRADHARHRASCAASAFRATVRTLANLALIGFLMVGVGNLAVVWAEQWVPSGLAALLVATAPFWMAIIEAFRTVGRARRSLQGGIGMAHRLRRRGAARQPGGSGEVEHQLSPRRTGDPGRRRSAGSSAPRTASTTSRTCR